MKDQRSRAPASVDNIYKLDGRVPVGKAIPFGLMIGAVIVDGLPRLQFACQGLLEAAVRAVRPDRGLYCLAAVRHGRF